MPAIRILRSDLADGAVEWNGRLGLRLEAAGAVLSEPLEVRLRVVESRDGGLHATGGVVGEIEEICRRCLVRRARKLNVELDIWFEPGLDVWDEEPGLYAIDPDLEELDLGPAVSEEVLLALPDFPLCREDCLGLCPMCGADRNEGSCDCRDEDPDPRWAALRASQGGGSPTRDDENQEG